MDSKNTFRGAVVRDGYNVGNHATVCIAKKAHASQWHYTGGSDRSWHGWSVGPCTCGTGLAATIDGALGRAVADFLKDGKTRLFDSNTLGEDGEPTGLLKYEEDGATKPLPPEYCAPV